MSAPAPAPAKQPTFNPRTLMDLYVREQYEELSDKLIEILQFFHGTTFYSVDAQAQYFVDAFTKVFLNLFTQPDYRLADRHVIPFVRLNLTIANVVGMSNFKTTDAWLELLMRQPANYAKILALYSARNTVKFDRRVFFDANAEAASLWFCLYGQAYRGGLVRPEVVQNLQEHYTYLDPRLQPAHEMQELYFGSTYVDGACDRPIKQAVNYHLRNTPAFRGAVINNRPDPKKIAVISGFWFPGHSVYRTLSGYIRSLKDKYHLTYFPLNDQVPNQDTGMFDEVRPLKINNGVLDIDPLRNNDFQVIYYPDIGMTPQSILLSNLRLAPIQMVGTGHPVSTWGSEIDYFISGADVEIPDKPERNYAERLVLLPGLGAIYNTPLYTLSGRKKTTSRILINGSWYAQKVNYRYCSVVKELIQRSKRDLHIRIFSGAAVGRQNDYLPFARELQKLFSGATVDVQPGRPYHEYMALMEEADLGIDCYHFGGSNTVSDNLHLRKPVVAWASDKWYGRIGSQLLRTAGLGELAASSEEEFLEIALRLIHDDDYRGAVTERVQKADLEHTIYDAGDARYFRKAVDYLIDNHARLKQDPDPGPVRIERD